MANFETTYLGLMLKSPIIVGSSGLTKSTDRIKEYESMGAGAIVLKSLFEEQIMHEVDSLAHSSDYTEAADYLRSYVTANSVQHYIELVRQAKAAVKIPVIASISCVSASQWVSFASQIQEAGADALEVNVFMLPTDTRKTPAELEEVYLTLADRLAQVLTIPVAFKLGSHFTNPLRVIEQLSLRKAKGVVLFNRFFEPDFNIDAMSIVAAPIFSNPADLRSTLRWVGMASHLVPKMDISASTGVHDGNALIKLILAGASSVQVCSAIYRGGAQQIATMLSTLAEWMGRKGYSSVPDFRGLMSYGKLENPMHYERSQFMKYYSSHE